MPDKLPTQFTTVTTFSKFVALTMFVALPFIGFVLGIWYANETEVVENTEVKVVVPTEEAKPNITPSPTKQESKIIVEFPKENDEISSPLIVKGQAKGSWFFEGEFPVILYYGVGQEFVTASAFAKGEWMTSDYVEFEAKLEFPEPQTSNGKLVLRKNNPSDLEEYNEEIEINIKFK